MTTDDSDRPTTTTTNLQGTDIMDTVISAPIRPDDISAAGAASESSWVAWWRSLDAPARRPDTDPMSTRARLLVAIAALLILVIGLLARGVGLQTLGSILLGLFLVGGVGAAASLTARWLTPVSFAVFAAAVGLAATIGVGFAMAETGLWFPRAAYAVLAGPAVWLLLRSVRLDVSALRNEAARPSVDPAQWSGVVVTATAIVGLTVAAMTAWAKAGPPQPGGLSATVGPIWYLGCAMIAAAFGYAVRARVSPAAPVLAAGTVVILSQALLYQAPTVMAAARHLGMTEYIRTRGSVDVSQDIYQAWPGLFAGTAWISEGTQSTYLLPLATWWPVLMTPVTILAVRLLAGRFLPPNRAWLAAAVFALGDAVNSVYYAPQVVGFLLSIVVLSLLVAPPAEENDRRRMLRLGFALSLICAVVVTHQISPFMLGFALTALVLFRLVQPWWAPLMAMVPAVGWALLHRHLLARYIDIDAIGNVVGNMAPPEQPDGVAVIAAVTRLVFYVPTAALLLLGLVALAVVARRRDRLHLGLAAATASPIGLVLATNYGQEGVFRVVLFAVPWLGILIASAWASPVAARNRPTTVGWRWLLVPVFVIMMAVNTYGQSGLDWARILRPGDAAVTAQFERIGADKATVLSLGTKNATPARITDRYDKVGYTSRLRVGGLPRAGGSAYNPKADLKNVTDAFTTTYAPGGHYLYVSDAIGAYDDRYGLQTYADYLRLKKVVAKSKKWVLVFESPTARLYKLHREPLGNGR